MKEIDLKLGDLLYADDGTCIYVYDTEYTNEFNPGGKSIK